MEATVIEEQRGLWIEERLLQQARLGGRCRIVIGEQEIRILPATTQPTWFPYSISTETAQTVLREVREEALALYGRGTPPDDQPYFGGMTWREYQALSDAQRADVWDRLYAQYDVEIEAVEERNVQPDALVAR